MRLPKMNEEDTQPAASLRNELGEKKACNSEGDFEEGERALYIVAGHSKRHRDLVIATGLA